MFPRIWTGVIVILKSFIKFSWDFKGGDRFPIVRALISGAFLSIKNKIAKGTVLKVTLYNTRSCMDRT